MSSNLLNFRPASYHKGKECYVSYYCVDPSTDRLRRVKVKVNHVKKPSERERFARALCNAINNKLYDGWNPFIEALNASSVTMADAIGLFMDAKSKFSRKSTIRSYKSYCDTFRNWLVKKRLQDRYCAMLETSVLESFLEDTDRIRNFSNRTWNNYCSFLYTFFDWLVSKKYIGSNPAAELKKRRTDNKFRTVIPAADRKRIKAWFSDRLPIYNYVMQLCYRLLMRPNEIVQLRVADIDFDDSIIRVRSEVAKNHGERLLAVPEDMMVFFRELACYPPQFFVFADRNTYKPGPRQMSPTRIAEKWKEMRDELKLPGNYQFYSLKDSGITEMLESGVPSKLVKELADHSSLEMTEKYMHRSNAKRILQYDVLHF